MSLSLEEENLLAQLDSAYDLHQFGDLEGACQIYDRLWGDNEALARLSSRQKVILGMNHFYAHQGHFQEHGMDLDDHLRTALRGRDSLGLGKHALFPIFKEDRALEAAVRFNQLIAFLSKDRVRDAATMLGNFDCYQDCLFGVNFSDIHHNYGPLTRCKRQNRGLNWGRRKIVPLKGQEFFPWDSDWSERSDESRVCYIPKKNQLKGKGSYNSLVLNRLFLGTIVEYAKCRQYQGAPLRLDNQHHWFYLRLEVLGYGKYGGNPDLHVAQHGRLASLLVEVCLELLQNQLAFNFLVQLLSRRPHVLAQSMDYGLLEIFGDLLRQPKIQKKEGIQTLETALQTVEVGEPRGDFSKVARQILGAWFFERGDLERAWGFYEPLRGQQISDLAGAHSLILNAQFGDEIWEGLLNQMAQKL